MNIDRYCCTTIIGLTAAALMTCGICRAEPLQGAIEHDEMNVPVERFDITNIPNNNMSAESPNSGNNRRPLAGGITTMQDEYWVDWQNWARRVASAIWGPLRNRQIMLYGQTRIRWSVTNDRQVHNVNQSAHQSVLFKLKERSCIDDVILGTFFDQI